MVKTIARCSKLFSERNDDWISILAFHLISERPKEAYRWMEACFRARLAIVEIDERTALRGNLLKFDALVHRNAGFEEEASQEMINTSRRVHSLSVHVVELNKCVALQPIHRACRIRFTSSTIFAITVGPS